MKMLGRKSVAATAASVLVLLSGGISASAADDAPTDATNPSCRQEVRRVAVWPKGGNPKFSQHARFEDRVVTTCDEKLSQAQRDAGEKKL